MKKMLQMLAAVTAAMGLASLCLPAGAGVGADQKIAIVNLQKVFDTYYKTIRSNQALKQEATEMDKQHQGMVDAGKQEEADWQKLIEKAEDQAVSAEERAKSKKAAQEKLNEVKTAEQTIQDFDRAAGAKLREKRRQRTDDILKEIRGVLDGEAKAGGYSLVLDVSGESANMAPVVLYSNGSNDLTENLVKELNAGAPMAPPDEKDAKPAKGAK
jgi:Skp family chaperone for outer membrane proteins